MGFLEQIKKLEYLDEMIQKGTAKSPREISTRLKKSEKTCYVYLQILRALGCPLYYCKRTHSYKTAVKGRLQIRWVPDSNKD